MRNASLGRRFGRWAALLSGLLIAGSVRGAQDKPFTSRELNAIKPADVGPDTIDVATYSPEQKENYKLFIRNCSICHTPARAINSSLVSREDWEHFVALMHGRLRSRFKESFWKEGDGRRIIDFLAYDARIRKVNNRESFLRQQREIAARFEAVQKEKAERAKHQPIQPSAPYTGAAPQASL